MITKEELVTPSGEQCDKRVEIRPGLFACWYPQMGGYAGKALIEICLTNGDGSYCFEAYVWHDGEFPFDSVNDPEKKVADLHHCDPYQFINFGQEVIDYANRNIRKVIEYHGGNE